MRKSLLLFLVALLMPLLGYSADNMALSKTYASYNTDPAVLNTETGLIVPYAAAGLAEQAVGSDDAAWNMSIGMWFNTTGIWTNGLKYGMIMRIGTLNHFHETAAIFLNQTSAGVLTLKLGGDNYGGSGSYTVGTAALNGWHHVLLVFDSANGQAVTYLDGEKTNTITDVTKYGYKWGDGEIQFISYGYSGALDEVQMFTKALNDEEAAQAYQNARSVNGLGALYTFDAVKEGTTGQYPSVAGSAGDVAATYYARELYYWAEGLCDKNSSTETAGTLIAGRELPAEEATMTITDAEGGTLTVSDGTNSYTAGTHTIMTMTDYTVTASCVEGYALKQINVVNGSETLALQSGESFTAQGDVTVTAEYTNDIKTLTIIAPQGVTATVLRNGSSVELDKMMTGVDYTVSVTVPSGKRVASVSLGDQELTATNGVYTFQMEADATLTVTIEDIPTYTVTIAQPANGTITVSKPNATGSLTALTSGATVLEGTVLTFSNSPANGYVFSSYTVNGSTYGQSTYTVAGNVTVSGVFEEGDPEYCAPTGSASDERYLTSFTVTDANSITKSMTVAPSTKNTYQDLSADEVFQTYAGNTLTFTFAGNGNWCHRYVWIDYGRDGQFDVDVNGTTPNGDLAAFDRWSPANNSDTYYDKDGNVASNGNPGNCAAQTLTVTLPSNLTAGNYRLRVRQGYNDRDACNSLNDSGSESGRACFDATIRIISSDYETPRTVTVAVDNDAYGTVAITNPTEGVEGTSITTTTKDVTISATAAEGYAFVNWTNAAGQIVSTSATYTYDGETDETFTAHFGAIVTLNVGANGSATMTANGSTINSGDVVEIGAEVVVTATANANYQLDAITVNGVEAEENPYTFTVTEPATIDVTFTDVTYSLTVNTTGNGKVVVSDNLMISLTEIDPTATEYTNGSNIVAGTGYFIHFIPGLDEELVSVHIEGCNADNNVLDYPEEGESIWFLVGGPDDGYYLSFEGAERMIVGFAEATGDMTVTAVFSGASTAIEGIEADEENGPVEYFNLQGVRVAAENLVPGVYVRRQGTKVQKVLVKK